MVDSGSCLHGDLCAIIASRSLAASICNLLPTGASSSQGILKSQLRRPAGSQLRVGHRRSCSSGEPSSPTKEHFQELHRDLFQDKGQSSRAPREGESLKEQVSSIFGFANLRLFITLCPDASFGCDADTT
jgi:hypothetical protein